MISKDIKLTNYENLRGAIEKLIGFQLIIGGVIHTSINIL